MGSKGRRALLGVLVIVPIAGFILNPNWQLSHAQPTYKLDVKPHLKPLATLKLEGTRLTRSEVEDDPGFRLQFHIRQLDGKSVSTHDARANPSIELPAATAGSFTVVLELFYPAYKGGPAQKGEFKSVSDPIGFKVDGGRIARIELPPPKKEPDPKKDKK